MPPLPGPRGHAHFLQAQRHQTGGDIFTVAVAFQYQEDGAGSFLHPGDYRDVSADVIFEKVLPSKGVLTFNGEYKNFDSDYDVLAFAEARKLSCADNTWIGVCSWSAC